MALAIIDDPGAIVIYRAVFIPTTLSMLAMGGGGNCAGGPEPQRRAAYRDLYSGWRGAVDGGAEVWRSCDPCRDRRLYDPA